MVVPEGVRAMRVDRLEPAVSDRRAIRSTNSQYGFILCLVRDLPHEGSSRPGHTI